MQVKLADNQTVPVLMTFSQRAWGSLSPAWRSGLAFFFAGRIFYSLWGALIWNMGLMPDYAGPFYNGIQPILEGLPGALLGVWQRWDGIHYQRIAMGGYSTDELTAFFPVYPYLGRLVHLLTGMSELTALILVGNLAFLLALVLFYEIIREHYGAETAQSTLLILIIFPTSFFFYAVYPMSLLMLWVLLAYWLARRQRWVGAALAGLAAGLTHLTTLPLTLLLGYEALRFVRGAGSRWRWAVLCVPFCNVLASAGFFAWRETASSMPYFAVQYTYGRSFAMPWETIAAFARYIIRLPLNVLTLVDWINALIFLLTVVVLLAGFRKMPIHFWYYQASLMIFLLLNIAQANPLLSYMRYALVLFPIFPVLAGLTQNRAARLAWFTISLLFNLFCASWFFMWKGGVS